MKNFILFLFLTYNTFAQVDSSLVFWPAHEGDVWQYRDAYDNEVSHTTIIDSVSIDSLTKDVIVYEKGQFSFYNHYKIDTSGNVYNNGIDSQYVRYKLYADSGDTWISGYLNQKDTITVTVVGIYDALVFGIYTKIKKFRFVQHASYLPNPIIFAEEYLAKGFGLVQSDQEPGNVFYLSGAIINGVKYGVITSIEKQNVIPKSFDIITNYPNPFNNSTIISYTIARAGLIKITLYGILGKQLKILVNEYKEKGSYKFRFSSNILSSGIYFLVLRTSTGFLTHKISLIK